MFMPHPDYLSEYLECVFSKLQNVKDIEGMTIFMSLLSGGPLFVADLLGVFVHLHFRG